MAEEYSNRITQDLIAKVAKDVMEKIMATATLADHPEQMKLIIMSSIVGPVSAMALTLEVESRYWKMDQPLTKAQAQAMAAIVIKRQLSEIVGLTDEQAQADLVSDMARVGLSHVPMGPTVKMKMV